VQLTLNALKLKFILREEHYRKGMGGGIKIEMAPFSVDHPVEEARTMRSTEDGQSTFHWKQPSKKKPTTSIYFQGIVSFCL